MKKYLIHLVLNIFLFLFLAHSAFCQARSDNIEVLIVDGFSNHDWKQTTQVVKSILEETNLFTVSVSTAPSEPDHEDWGRWDPNFRDYDVIIQNTNNIHNEEITWSKKVRENIESYVQPGGGLYILHSANNAFPDWEEYNLMIGLGWRSLNEGVALQVKDNGQIKKISVGDGKETYHGPRDDEVIHILNDHPINNGFPQAWKTPNMELYKYARGPAQNLTVLSYARDEETGINWPVEWVVDFSSHLTDDEFQKIFQTEQGGMKEIMADLYGITGDKKYLNLSKRFTYHAVMNLIANSNDQLEGLHANTQIPKIIGAARLPKNVGGINASNAVMMGHVRKVYWTDDGWPVVAPERYAGVPQQPIAEEDIIGTWEEITMKYQYQTMQTSYEVIFKEDHTLGGALDGSWSYDEANQTLRVNGTKLIIDNAWDWEASPRQTTITYAGLTDSGRSIWGKKIKDQ